MKVLLFVRVSTELQSLDRQVEELTDFSMRQGWSIVKVIKEIGSGSNAIKDRAAIKELNDCLLNLSIQKVIVSEISRIGRSTAESLAVIDHLTKLRISCFEYQRRIETLNEDLTVNPIAELILSVLASVAKMEKVQLVARIKSGMVSAARKGIHIGRAPGSVKSTQKLLEENKDVVRSLTSERLSIRKIAKLYQVSPSTVVKVKKAIDARKTLRHSLTIS